MQIYRGSEELSLPDCNVYSSRGYAAESFARFLCFHSRMCSPLCRVLLFETAIRKDNGAHLRSQQAARQGAQIQFFYELQVALLIRHLFVITSSTHPRSSGWLGTAPRTENHMHKSPRPRKTTTSLAGDLIEVQPAVVGFLLEKHALTSQLTTSRFQGERLSRRKENSTRGPRRRLRVQ